MKLGKFDLTVVSDGTFRLDGGAMFGPVPRVLWSRWCEPDADNRIVLGLNCLLARWGDNTMLVDTGMGTKWDPKMAALYDLQREPGLLGGLEALGVSPADVTHVVLTHLHIDHAGGATTRGADGLCTPTFPNAQYIVQKGEWDAAHHPDVRSKPSYVADDFTPIANSGQLRLIEGDVEILPGVRTHVTGGHTRDHQIVILESHNQTAAFLADLMPTAAHLKPNYTMGYDLYPLDVMAQRARVADWAEKQEWLCIFEHDAHTPLGRLTREGEKLKVEPVTAG